MKIKKQKKTVKLPKSLILGSLPLRMISRRDFLNFLLDVKNIFSRKFNVNIYIAVYQI